MSVKKYNQAYGGNPNSRDYRPGEDAITTHEGGLAYKLNWQESVTQLVMTGLIGSSYYSTEEEQLAHTKQVWEDAIKAAKADNAAADYLAKLISYGREVGGMKFQPVLGLVYLSTLEDKQWFKAAFPHVIKTPKDAHDFVNLARKANIRKGLGRTIKRELQDYLRRLKTYHVRRYTGKLSDVVKVARPATIKGTLADKRLTYVMKGEPGSIEEFADLQKARNQLGEGTVTAETLGLIKQRRMQLEELKPFFGTITAEQRRQVFGAMIPGLSIMALIQNLVTIERTFSEDADACDCRYLTPAIIRMVEARLGDVEAYKRSRMLPFTPLIARKMTDVSEWRTALEKLISAGCQTMFDPEKLAGKSVRINIDTSGSMQGCFIANANDNPNKRKRRQSTPQVSVAEFVGIMGSALYQAMPDKSSIWAVATSYKRVPVRTCDPFKLGEEVMATDVEHGTYFEQMITGVVNSLDGYKTLDVPEAAYQGEDVYILLTDGMQADNLERAWAQVKKPKGARLIIWDIDSYRMRISNRPDVLCLWGYSNSMMDTVRRIIEEGKDQVQQIEAYSLATPGKVEAEESEEVA